MQQIKILIAITSIVIGVFLINSCSTIEMDDPAEYVVLFALENYNIECIVGKDCDPEDISITNDGFWIANLKEEGMNYEVLYDEELISSGYITREREKNGEREMLVPITDKICSSMPKKIAIDLFPDDSQKTDHSISISLVKKN